jgi:hypothetical protein
MSTFKEFLQEAKSKKVVSIQDFIKQEFEKNKYKAEYGDVKTFEKDNGADFTKEWLAQYKGQYFTEIDTILLARGLISHGNIKLSRMVPALRAFTRSHDFEYPGVSGILTDEYWKAKLK